MPAAENAVRCLFSLRKIHGTGVVLISREPAGPGIFSADRGG